MLAQRMTPPKLETCATEALVVRSMPTTQERTESGHRGFLRLVGGPYVEVKQHQLNPELRLCNE